MAPDPPAWELPSRVPPPSRETLGRPLSADRTGHLGWLTRRRVDPLGCLARGCSRPISSWGQPGCAGCHWPLRPRPVLQKPPTAEKLAPWRTRSASGLPLTGCNLTLLADGPAPHATVAAATVVGEAPQSAGLPAGTTGLGPARSCGCSASTALGRVERPSERRLVAGLTPCNLTPGILPRHTIRPGHPKDEATSSQGCCRIPHARGASQPWRRAHRWVRGLASRSAAF